MTYVLASVFVASLVGSLHCAGMCGGLVGFVAGSTRREVRPQLTYHVGRLLAYVALGSAAGALGSALNLGGALAGVSEVAAVLAALLMIGWGLYRLLPLERFAREGVRLGRGPSRSLGSVVGAWLARGNDLSPVVRGALLGVFTGALPCGWLYAFVVAAAGTGSALGGAALMSAFWLGTVPALVGVGALVAPLSKWLGRRTPLLLSLALVVLGVGTLTARYGFAPEPSAPENCPLHPRGPVQ